MDEIVNNNATDKRSEAAFIAWYEDICTERISMLEAEEGYKKRIEELERNNLELLQAFNETQSEVKHVRAKYEPEHEGSELVYKEPYNKVLSDRDKLRQDKISLKNKLEKAETRIVELTESLTLSSREGHSASSELHSDSLSSSDEFELPAIVPNKKLNATKHKRYTSYSKDKIGKIGVQKEPKNEIKTKHARTKGKMCYVITGKDKIAKLENENLTLRMKLRGIEHENDILQLRMDAHEKKIDDVKNASKACVNGLKQLNAAMGQHGTGTFTPRNEIKMNENGRTTSTMSLTNSYRSMFLSRKLSHKVSSRSLPVIRTAVSNSILKVDRELFTYL